MAGVDLSVFQRSKTINDFQKEFEQQKQAQLLQKLQVGAAIAQAGNGGLTQKDLLGFQLQAQNHADDLAFKQMQLQSNNDLRQQGLAQQAQLAQLTMGNRMQEYETKKQDKLDMQMRGDQNALTGAVQGIDQQIADLDNLIGVKDPNGNYIKPPAEGLSGNFGIRSVLPNLPGTKAADAAAMLEKIKAGTLLSGLNNLKSQSATGASGLGSLTEREGAAVQNAQAALQSGQSIDQLLKNAANYRNQLAKSKTNLVNGFNNIYRTGATVEDPLGLRK